MSYIDAKESTLQHTSTSAKKITQFFPHDKYTKI
jgi:hypothetical protein